MARVAAEKGAGQADSRAVEVAVGDRVAVRVEAMTVVETAAAVDTVARAATKEVAVTVVMKAAAKAVVKKVEVLVGVAGMAVKGGEKGEEGMVMEGKVVKKAAVAMAVVMEVAVMVGGTAVAKVVAEREVARVVVMVEAAKVEGVRAQRPSPWATQTYSCFAPRFQDHERVKHLLHFAMM